VNVGASHWDMFALLSAFNTVHERSNLDLSISSCVLGTGKGRAWCGLTLSFSLMLHSLPVKTPSVPSNKSSYFFRSVL
jgi:hypothetical protein